MEIYSKEEYDQALLELERLWHTVEVGTPEGDRFEVLAQAIDEYECKNFPI